MSEALHYDRPQVSVDESSEPGIVTMTIAGDPEIKVRLTTEGAEDIALDLDATRLRVSRKLIDGE